MQRRNLILIIALTTMALSLNPLCHAAPVPAKFIGEDTAAGISKAVVVEKVPLVHTAQFFPKKADASAPKQIDSVLSQLTFCLKGAQSSISEVVKINVYAASPEVVADVKKLFAKKLPHKPAVTFVTGALPKPGMLVAMDAVAISRDNTTELKRVPNACILPASGVVYISGQADKAALVEATGNTLKKLEDTLKFLGLSKEDVVQCKAFMQPMEKFDEVKAVFEKFFGPNVPPLVFVDWTSKDVPIEIELIAASKPASNEPLEYLTQPGVTPSPVYSKIVRVNAGRLIYISGLYGKTANNAEAEITESFAELTDLLKQSGSDLTHLAKATYYVSNNETSNKLNELRPRYYDPKRPPAASKAAVKGVGITDRGITFDMIAVTR